MTNYVVNKICVVTGGADGIGFSIADSFLENGCRVAVLVDINESRGIEAAKDLKPKHGEGKAVFIKCDVTKDLEAAYNTIIKNYEAVDVLVNSAGIADEETPRRLMEINAIATIEWSLKFFKHMRNDKGGKGGTIVNISSLLGIRIAPYAHVYLASKFAVNGFTRSLGHNKLHARSGVRVVSLCPGYTETNLTKDLLSKKAEDEFDNKILENIRSLNWQRADAVGKAALRILDDAESGTVWTIDGGKLNQVIFPKFKL